MNFKNLLTEDASAQATLTRELMKTSNQYYNSGVSLMSDYEFDTKVTELKKMEKESGYAYVGSPTFYIGASPSAALKVVAHEAPALSLDKVKYAERESLLNWLGSNDGVMSWKMDGLTVVVTYENGQLLRAVTRGNGLEGEDITHNAIYFHGLPTHIADNRHIVVRGEAVMSYEEFNRVNSESGGIYENARNLASATIRMLDSAESRKRQIQFYAFKLVVPAPDTELRTESERFNFLSSLGFSVVRYSSTNKDSVLSDIDAWQKILPENPYPTDGLVFSYDDQVYAESLGNTGHHPRGSIALKWTDETVETDLRYIEWSVGKTGIITPVAVFSPVRLGAGSTVTRASLHNLSIMENIPCYGDEESRLEIGSIIKVGLANMIIPQVYGQKAGTPKKMKPIHVPDECPVCKTETLLSERNGVKVLYCPNANCPARIKGMLVNAFGRSGLNIKGLGPVQIEDLQQAGFLTSYPAEVYTLKKIAGSRLPEALKKKDGWGEKSWRNLLDAIDASRKTTLQRVLYSLGIPLLGHDLSKKLAGYWEGDAEKLMSYYEEPSYDELVKIDGVGDIKARNVYDWCRFTKADAVKNMMFHVLMDELQIVKPTAKESDASLNGLTFVITGDVHVYKNRDEFKASVEARGGKVSGSVSKKTNFLVINDLTSTTGKAQKARELGVPMISEDQFIEKFSK